jgi:hypothetical protein
MLRSAVLSPRPRASGPEIVGAAVGRCARPAMDTSRCSRRCIGVGVHLSTHVRETLARGDGHPCLRLVEHTLWGSRSEQIPTGECGADEGRAQWCDGCGVGGLPVRPRTARRPHTARVSGGIGRGQADRERCAWCEEGGDPAGRRGSCPTRWPPPCALAAARDQTQMSQTEPRASPRKRSAPYHQQPVRLVEPQARPIRLNQPLALAGIVGEDLATMLTTPNSMQTPPTARPHLHTEGGLADLAARPADVQRRGRPGEGARRRHLAPALAAEVR